MFQVAGGGDPLLFLSAIPAMWFMIEVQFPEVSPGLRVSLFPSRDA